MLSAAVRVFSHAFSVVDGYSLSPIALEISHYFTSTKKISKPKDLNDYRPIAFRPIIMKCFERVVVLYLFFRHLKIHQHIYIYLQS